MSQECNRCKEAGFPGQMISFAQDGTKRDGSKKWKLLDSNGVEHVHKVKAEEKPLTPEQQRQADIQKAHLENIQASTALTNAILRLATAIEKMEVKK